MAIGWPIASALSGRLLHRLGYRALIRGGLLLTFCASVWIALFLRPGASLAVPRTLTAVYGLGLGFANTPLVIAVQTSVPWNRRGVATASTMFFRTIGGTLAVGILGGVLAAALASSGAPAGAVDRLLGPERATVDPAVVQGIAGVLQAGMTRMFWTICAIAFAAFAVSLAFPRLAVAAGGKAAPGRAAGGHEELSPGTALD
jgi:MFS family permease